ncbi:MAG: site-specific DNA-methyltransferase [Planctomycetes bacterium]|nr:site-specific DNA-methyltransferase [Planctomycetota bacterium]
MSQTSVNTLRQDFSSYLQGAARQPLFLCGDSLRVLREIPDESVDCVMTSPPYWGHRQYDSEGIGLEADYRDYIGGLASICDQLKRIVKTTGSFWLNLGDTYRNKQLSGIPWRVALTLIDEQGWILRNDVIWNKVKGGPDNAKDKLGNVHEHVFHFVKRARGYYYDVDSIRNTPRKSLVKNGAVVSATGVTGVRYKRQIELSTALSNAEKQQATEALNQKLQAIADGQLADFRMIIRGQQRTTHSDSGRVSGRARELQEKGFYFLQYHPKGSKPRDVWDILPEDTQKRKLHFAPYPEDLCRIPITATCPEDGIVLDPFCGTGTTNLVAFYLDRKSVGIDLSEEYIRLAKERCRFLL